MFFPRTTFFSLLLLCHHGIILHLSQRQKKAKRRVFADCMPVHGEIAMKETENMRSGVL